MLFHIYTMLVILLLLLIANNYFNIKVYLDKFFSYIFSNTFLYYLIGKILDRSLSFFRTALQMAILSDALADLFSQLNRLFSIFRRSLIDNSFQSLFATYYNNEKKNLSHKRFAGFVLFYCTSFFIIITLLLYFFPVRILTGINFKKIYFIVFSPIVFLMCILSIFKTICDCEKLFFLSGFSQSFGNICFISTVISIPSFTGFILGSIFYCLSQVFYFLPHVYKFIEISSYTNTKFFKDFLFIQINCLTAAGELIVNIIATKWTGVVSQLDNSHKIVQFVFSIVTDPIISASIHKIENKDAENYNNFILLFHLIAIPLSFLFLFKGKFICYIVAPKKVNSKLVDVLRIIGSFIYFYILNRALGVVLVHQKKIGKNSFNQILGSIALVVFSFLLKPWKQIGLAIASNLVVLVQFLIYFLQSNIKLKDFFLILFSSLGSLLLTILFTKANSFILSASCICILGFFILKLINKKLVFALPILIALLFYFNLFEFQWQIYSITFFTAYFFIWRKYLLFLRKNTLTNQKI